MSLIWVSSILLFLLLFLNILAVDKKKILERPRAQVAPALITLALIFLFFPVLQTALASLLVRDADFVLGVAVSSLAPCALVNPFFARVRGGNEELALWIVLLSTLLCPLATVPLLKLLGLSTVFLDARFLGLYLLTLTTGPLLLSFLLAPLIPAQWLRPKLPLLNSLILAVLMFILVGSSLNRVPLRFLLNQDFYMLILIFLLVDFGLYALMRHVSAWFISPADAETVAISVATRNFAVSASLMLFFHPKAALPSAVGLIVHCLFFQFLLWKKSPALRTTVPLFDNART
ncbi:MAG: hypothetical protein KF799_09110 [Bdellovibrionales bacterium]|nr:hypothetical protein [Bdellovibrionales bacterium]